MKSHTVSTTVWRPKDPRAAGHLPPGVSGGAVQHLNYTPDRQDVVHPAVESGQDNAHVLIPPLIFHHAGRAEIQGMKAAGRRPVGGR